MLNLSFFSYLMENIGILKLNEKKKTMIQDQVRKENWAVEVNR